MGATIFIIISVLIYVIKIIHNSHNLTYDKWCEIFISFFIFTNCIGFGLPLIDLDLQTTCGSWGYKFRLEVFMIITPIFFIVIAKKLQWKLLPISTYTLLCLIAFAAINIFNPNNLSIPSTAIALAQLFTYLIFLYIMCSCIKSEVLLKAIYEGFLFTVILQTALTICYPILGISQVAGLFRDNVSIRSVERPGAPGTFSHPNSLGGYMVYVVLFFVSCYIMNYRKRSSLILAAVAFFVLIFTFSRTALLASLISIIAIITIYTTRNGRIFTIKNIFTLILPLFLGGCAFLFLSPIRNSFIGSNMDEMMLARLLHFYCGYETIIEHPFIGVGLNAHLEYIRNNIDFGATFGDISKIFWRAEEFMFSHPIHNIFLILLSEMGIVGLLPTLYFIGRRFYNVKKYIRSDISNEDKILYLYSIALICSLGIHGMADWAPLSLQLRNIWILIFFATSVYITKKQIHKEDCHQ